MISYLKHIGDSDRMYPYRIFSLRRDGGMGQELILRESEVALNIKIKNEEHYKILDTRVKNRRGSELRGVTLISIGEDLIRLLKLNVRVVKNVEKIHFILEEKNK